METGLNCLSTHITLISVELLLVPHLKLFFLIENRECSILSKGMCALYIFLQRSTVLFTNFCYQLLCRRGKKGA